MSPERVDSCSEIACVTLVVKSLPSKYVFKYDCTYCFAAAISDLEVSVIREVKSNLSWATSTELIISVLAVRILVSSASRISDLIVSAFRDATFVSIPCSLLSWFCSDFDCSSLSELIDSTKAVLMSSWIFLTSIILDTRSTMSFLRVSVSTAVPALSTTPFSDTILSTRLLIKSVLTISVATSMKIWFLVVSKSRTNAYLSSP